MNQDFALLATPGNLRRLMLFQQVCAMEISDELHTMAKRDMLDEQHFDPLVCPYHPVKLAITQFLLDCNLRGIVLADYHPEYNEIAVLHALKLAQAERIHIITNRSARWSAPIAALSLESITHTSQLLQLSKEEIDQRHNTVLIVDCNMGVMHGRLRIAAQEYPRIIIYQSDDGHIDLHTQWVIWAHVLFPTMPHPLYVHLVENIPSAWRRQPLMRFAPLYNTCLFPDLITDRDLLRRLGDAEVLRSLQYRGMLMPSTF